MQFEQALDLLMLLIIVVALFLAHRSIPADKVDMLITKAKEGAAKTDTKIDDMLLEVVGLLRTLQPETPKPETPVTINVPNSTATTFTTTTTPLDTVG